MTGFQTGYSTLVVILGLFIIACSITFGGAKITTNYPEPIQEVAGEYLALTSEESKLKNSIISKESIKTEMKPVAIEEKEEKFSASEDDELSEINLSDLDAQVEELSFEEDKLLNELISKLSDIGIDKLEIEALGDGLNLKVEKKQETKKINKNPLGKVVINLFGGVGQKEITVKSENNTYKIESDGLEFETKLPLSIDGDNDQLQVETSRGENKIRILPKDALTALENKKVLHQIEKIELVENENKSSLDKVKLKVKGVKKGKIFGLVPVSAQVESEVGGLSGEVLNSSQPFWMKVLSPVIQ